jgi:hypothetical protein
MRRIADEVAVELRIGCAEIRQPGERARESAHACAQPRTHLVEHRGIERCVGARQLARCVEDVPEAISRGDAEFPRGQPRATAVRNGTRARSQRAAVERTIGRCRKERMRFESEHHVVEETAISGVFRMVRHSTTYRSLPDCEQEFVGLLRWLSPLRTHALLVDLRVARGRNDPGFEACIAAGRRALFKRFTELACLVATLPGKMQLERYAREDGVAMQVFLCVDDAERWLAERQPLLRRVAR